MNVYSDAYNVVFLLTLILSFVFNVAAFEMISPISIMHRGIIYGFGLGWTLILAVFLFDLVGIKDGFCGHICPLGGFYSIISKYAALALSALNEPSAS